MLTVAQVAGAGVSYILGIDLASTRKYLFSSSFESIDVLNLQDNPARTEPGDPGDWGGGCGGVHLRGGDIRTTPRPAPHPRGPRSVQYTPQILQGNSSMETHQVAGLVSGV